MKTTTKLNLFRIRGSLQEFDDRPDYVYPVEIVALSYFHILINKKIRLRKEAIKYAKSICRWPYIIILTDKPSMENIIRVQDGFTVDVCGKVFTGGRNVMYKTEQIIITEQIMITEDYVSFEVAKLLKEKGFKFDSCSTYYTLHGEVCEFGKAKKLVLLLVLHFKWQ